MSYQVDVYLMALSNVSHVHTRFLEERWRARLYAFWRNLPALGIGFTYAAATCAAVLAAPNTVTSTRRMFEAFFGVIALVITSAPSLLVGTVSSTEEPW